MEEVERIVDALVAQDQLEVMDGEAYRYRSDEIWLLRAPDARPLPAWTEPYSIWAALDGIKTLGRSLRENAYVLGKTLIFVKPRVRHGCFLRWLRENVRAFSRQTAAHLMNFATECDQAGTLLDYHPGKCKTILHSPPAPADTPRRRADMLACSQGLLEAEGYAVLRVAGRDRPWDLIGFSATDTLLCRVATQELPADRDNLISFPTLESVRKVVHLYKDGQTAPVVDALTGVEVNGSHYLPSSQSAPRR